MFSLTVQEAQRTVCIAILSNILPCDRSQINSEYRNFSMHQSETASLLDEVRLDSFCGCDRETVDKVIHTDARR